MAMKGNKHISICIYNQFNILFVDRTWRKHEQTHIM